MTSTDIIRKLFIAYSKQDDDEFYRLAEEFIDLEKRKKHNLVVKELKEALYSKNTLNRQSTRRYRTDLPIPRDNDNGFPLLEIREHDLTWDELVLSEENRLVLEQLIHEFKSMEVLATYNLRPANKVLFCGAPGTGKTFSAQVLSSVLQIPLVYVRFDAIISSYLGETATNLRKVFEFIKNGIWIVLFDEVDIIGKNRDDHYESGEIKRVVNNFLQMLDGFDGESLIIAATNHPHILDPAIWRRFDEVINFKLPTVEERHRLLKQYLSPIKKSESIDIMGLATKTEKFSPSDLKGMCKEAMKHAIVNGMDVLSKDDVEFAYSRFVNRYQIREDAEVNE
ncbi:ATP-binding protein [Alicyclobacillus sp. TC]|uniref:SpoVK/Ycf46/Vps4 family AAA+-type ATPase n=1 Tax=Alicyclobacillus tolerans TaxID=90970 RepID=A0ABT9LZB1_9BACL|nr:MULTISPECIES: ATP-binding protein [Alicyclobacillus]MCY0870767.1 ATP-binding protein [Bacillota bacterium]MDP9729611.1 SpoVK/Ycf46/Vps4 family AAA+-type ATPase [Alicyclobacillus tengchongensis]QRF23576.1 ATP-binding protein [Alicyclobacillus sp. TC]